MAVHDYVIDNSTGANVRADINNALLAIVSNNSSSSEPSTTKYAYMWWADTTNGILKIRNSANDGWVELLQLDGTLTLEDGTVSAPGLAFRDDLNTGVFSSAADTFNVATGGVERMELGASTIFNEDGANVDFRIEGDTQQYLFYLDAGNDRIGILTSTPQHDLDILKTGSGSDSSFRVASTGSSGDNDATIVINNGGSGDASLRFDYESSASRCKIYVSSSTNDLIFDTDGNETMRLIADHRMLLGSSSSKGIAGGNAKIQVQATDSTGRISIVQNRNEASGAPFLSLAKTRGTSVNSNTVVQNGDNLGTIAWAGGDGTDVHSVAAQIVGKVTDNPGSNDMPGSLQFYTTPNASDTPKIRIELTHKGEFQINNQLGSGNIINQVSRASGNTTETITPTQLGLDDNNYALLYIVVSGTELQDWGHSLVSWRMPRGGNSALVTQVDAMASGSSVGTFTQAVNSNDLVINKDSDLDLNVTVIGGGGRRTSIGWG